MTEPIVVPLTNGAKPPPPPAPVAEPPKPAEADPKLKAEYDKMAAREKTTLAERQKLAEDRRALESERAQHAKDLEEAKQSKAWRESANKDPETTAKALWGDNWFSHLSELALDKKPPPSLEVAALREELIALKNETKAEKEARLDADKKRKEQEDVALVERFNSDTIAKVKGAADKYKLIDKLNYHDQVPELIRKHWLDQVNRVNAGNMTTDEMKSLSWEEAAQMVEDHWTTQGKLAAEVLGLTSASKPAQPNSTKAPEGVTRGGTLTNDLHASSAVAPATAPKMTPEEAEKERTKRAFAAFDAAKAAQKR